MVDASWRISPNPPGSHHNGSVADVDGDGHLDVMITDIGVGLPSPVGVFFLMGDGRGNFTRSVSRVPLSIRFLTVEENVNVPDRHSTSSAVFADFDGDGRVDIVATAGNFDPITGKQTMRFYRQMPDGTFVEQRRLEIPPALAESGLCWEHRVRGSAISTATAYRISRSCGRAADSYVQLLRNDGNFQFTDITIQALGSYQPQPTGRRIAKTPLADVQS